MPFPQRLSQRQLDARIDAVSYSGGPSLKGMSFAYSFESSPDPSLPLIVFASEYRDWTQPGKQAVRAAMAEFAEVLDISFHPARKGEAADLQFFRADDLKGADGWGGFGYAGEDWNGYVAIRTPQTTEPALLMHEIGHALGLKHPGDYGDAPPPFLPRREDTTDFTVMSYEDGRHDPTTPMIYDVAALQARWGENRDAHLGRTRWTAPEAGEAAVIWDAGGRDAIVHKGPASARIDLREGAFSSFGEGNTLAVAYGARIENALGGRGEDRLIGNGAANTLKGRGGDDVLHGGARRDILLGGRGDDVLDGQRGDDRLRGGAGVDEFRYARGAGADKILDFEAGEVVVLARVKGFRQLDIADRGGDAHVTARGVDLTIKGWAAEDLDAGDFQFV